MFLKNGKNFGLNPGKRGLHALILIKFADLCFDRGGIAIAGEELIAGHEVLGIAADGAAFAQDSPPGLENEAGVADSGALSLTHFTLPTITDG